MTKQNNYAHFSNRDCEYFPCHSNVDKESFNCLFCYCPLYALGDKCGGNFKYTTTQVKDCSSCAIPHTEGGYDYIMKNFKNLVEMMAENRKKEMGEQE